MDSSNEAPILRQRYRRNRNFAVSVIYVALGYTMRPLYFPVEQLRRALDTGKYVTMLNIRAGAVTSWLRRKIAQPTLPRRNRRSTGALGMRQKLEYCRLLPVLAGAQTRRSPAQLLWTSRIIKKRTYHVCRRQR